MKLPDSQPVLLSQWKRSRHYFLVIPLAIVALAIGPGIDLARLSFVGAFILVSGLIGPLMASSLQRQQLFDKGNAEVILQWRLWGKLLYSAVLGTANSLKISSAVITARSVMRSGPAAEPTDSRWRHFIPAKVFEQAHLVVICQDGSEISLELSKHIEALTARATYLAGQTGLALEIISG